MKDENKLKGAGSSLVLLVKNKQGGGQAASSVTSLKKNKLGRGQAEHLEPL